MGSAQTGSAPGGQAAGQAAGGQAGTQPTPEHILRAAAARSSKIPRGSAGQVPQMGQAYEQGGAARGSAEEPAIFGQAGAAAEAPPEVPAGTPC